MVEKEGQKQDHFAQLEKSHMSNLNTGSKIHSEKKKRPKVFEISKKKKQPIRHLKYLSARSVHKRSLLLLNSLFKC